MKHLRIGTAMLALGIILGSGTAVTLRPVVVAAEQSTSTGDMRMASQSAGDTEMNAAMTHMMQAMSKSALTGVQDRDFMVMMIPHHQSAVDMANIELLRGTHPELKALAREIIKSQNQEIAQMRNWLQAWYGHAP